MKLNKKGAELKAGVWIIGLISYFIIFSLIIFAAETVENDLSPLESNTIKHVTEWEECSEPRLRYYPDGEIKEETIPNLIDCDRSRGVISELECLDIEGCNWTETTTGMLWWASTYYTCNGIINTSFYGINDSDIQTYLSGKDHISNRFTSVCVHPAVLDSRENCEVFSCKWSSYEPDLTSKNPIKLISTIGSVFTLEYDFGFNNPIIISLLYIIFFALPLIALSLALYFLIR